MIAATPPTDPVAAFNAQLAQAKLAALAILQNLPSAIEACDAPSSAAFRVRELRLVAATILRTREIKAASQPPPPCDDDTPPDAADESPTGFAVPPARPERASSPIARRRAALDPKPQTPPPITPQSEHSG